MQYGVCGDINMAIAAEKASYDYFETPVAVLLKPEEPEAVFEVGLGVLRETNLPCPVVVIFLPGSKKITGPDVDGKSLQAFVNTVMRRAERARVKIVAFGSGGARNIPEGFDRQTAHAQIVAFSKMAAKEAYNHGVTIGVEALNKQECNVLNTLSECASVIDEVSHPAFRLLIDGYHLMKSGDSYDDIVKYGHLLVHAHIATIPNRLAPGAEGCDFKPFFDALKKANYTGRISIEGGVPNPDADLPKALQLMRSLAD